MKIKPLIDPDIHYAGIDLSPKPYNGRTVYARGPGLRRPDDGIIDTVAVVRALQGEPVKLSSREAIAVIALGTACGMSDERLAQLLGLTERSVFRKRIESNIPPSQPMRGTGGYQKRKDNNIPPSVPPTWVGTEREEVA